MSLFAGTPRTGQEEVHTTEFLGAFGLRIYVAPESAQPFWVEVGHVGNFCGYTLAESISDAAQALIFHLYEQEQKARRLSKQRPLMLPPHD